MTKEEIIKIIIVALIGAFSKSLFDNLLGKYIPDKKKLNSVIIKFLVFNLRYTLIIYFLAQSFLSPGNIDKPFVFKVSILTTSLFFNLLIDIFSYFLKRYNSQIKSQGELNETQLNQFKRLLTIVENKIEQINGLENIVERLIDNIQTQVDITRQIADKIPDKE